MSPAFPGCAFVRLAQPPYSGTNPALPRTLGVAGQMDTIFPNPFPRKQNKQKQKKQNPHPLLGMDTRAIATRRPEPPSPVGTEVPALRQALSAGPGHSPAAAARARSSSQVFEAPASSSQVRNQGAPSTGAAKTWRGRARESPAGRPRAGTGPARIRC